MSCAVSIVVPTRNRAEHLAQTLPYYNLIHAKADWELIVVDNGSTDDTPNVLRAFEPQAQIKFLWLCEPLPGASRARNLGAKSARGQVIAFLDDDCYPRRDYVDALERSFSTLAIDYLAGRILLFDSHDAAITIQESLESRVFSPKSFIYPGIVHGANMALRREVMEETGGFDVQLGAGTEFAGEDCDLLSRASALGFTGVYDPRPIVYHHHRRQSFDLVRQLAAYYDHGRGAYYMKGLKDPLLRRQAALMWFKSALRNAFNNHWGIIFRELQGAAHYRRVRAGLSESTGTVERTAIEEGTAHGE
jgi:glycosyltransferase involved in cell wall biosynthesis